MNVILVEFGTLTDEKRIRLSHVQITSDETVNSSNMPIPGGVIDRHLGSTNYKLLCGTCENNNNVCVGHMGHTVLKTTCIVPLLVVPVRQWLKIICHSCGILVVTNVERVKKVPQANRLSVALSLVSEAVTCSCGAKLHNIKKEEGVQHSNIRSNRLSKLNKRDKDKVDKELLYPHKILTIFSRIKPETIEIMGENPIHYLMNVMMIPPTTVRPPIQNFSGVGNTLHDFTNIITHIINCGKRINIPAEYPYNKSTGHMDDVQMDRMAQTYYDFIYCLVKGVNPTQSANRGFTTGTRPLKSITKDMTGKEGKIRSNCLGARTTNMGRSTISCNCSFKIDELGIPIAMARTLQIKEIVQHYNIEYLMKYIINGTSHYPGCTLIVKANGTKYNAAIFDKSQLEIGDSIFRDLVDGDLVFFNRQPTLDSASIGVHKIKVIMNPNIKTIPFNVLACTFYHADFDGDQMNVGALKINTSRAEAKYLSGVENHFISIGTSSPKCGQVQDSIMGCYYLTKTGIKLDKYHAMALFASTQMDLREFEDIMYSGRDIVSLALSKTPINYNRKCNSYQDIYEQSIKYDPLEKKVVIKNGKMLEGVLDKKSVGAVNGSIYHIISREYGKTVALDVIYAMQQLANNFLMMHGFTTSPNDLIISRESFKDIHNSVVDTLTESNEITKQLINGEIIAPIGSTVREHYEKLQINALKLNDSAIMQSILSNVKQNNGFFTMIATGSKGNNPNFSNICGAVGNVTLNDARMADNFSHGRVSIYSRRYDTSPYAYGFVPNSYMSGLDIESFCHLARLARYAMISGALFTAITGFFLRKGTMNNQGSIVNNMRQVAKNIDIIQFIYGDDGFDPRELERVKISSIFMSNADIEEVYGRSAEIVKTDRDDYRNICLRFESINSEHILKDEIDMPINISRLVESINNSKISAHIADKNNAEKYKIINSLCNNLQYILLNDIQERAQSPVSEVKMRAVWLAKVYLRSELLKTSVIDSLSIDDIKYINMYVRVKYSKALMSYGAAVGIIAAQYLTGPITQSMLDAKHKSASGGTKTSGMTRINEIYQGKKVADEQYSSMIIHVLSDIKQTAITIEHLTVKLFVKRVDIILEAYDDLKYPKYIMDSEWIESYFKYHSNVSTSGLTNYCVRLVINKTTLILKSITLEALVQKIRAKFIGCLILHTSEVAQEIVVRIWIKNNYLSKTGVERDRVVAFMNDILKCSIRGCNRINTAAITTKSFSYVDSEGKIARQEKEVIITNGTNIYEVALHTAVDKTKISSNSVDDTYNMFGIAAARNKIINETGIYLGSETINFRHLHMYADEMTRHGKVSSIERGGLAAREKNNTFLGACYGDPVKSITSAMLNKTKNPINDIMSAQLLGAVPTIGTKYNGILIDEEFIKQNYKSPDEYLNF
jgi:DNA-directed RNA polymerase beta' subunit